MDLPLYVSETEREAETVPHVVPAWFRASTHAVETVVHEIGRRAPTLDRLVLPSTFESGPILVISRLVLLRPHDAATAFDGWRPTADCVSAGGGVLALGPALEGLRPPRLRALDARLVLPRSAVTLPVELELMTWDAFHTILSLRLRGRVRRMVSRRPRYFAAGHAALDDIRDQLEGRAGAHSYRQSESSA